MGKNELGFLEVQKILNNYIDAAYYFYGKKVDSVKENIEAIINGNMNSIVPSFSRELERNSLSSQEFTSYLKDYFDKFVLADPTIYINDVISKYNFDRYSKSGIEGIDTNDIRLSVINHFGDKVYYNAERLEFLRELYGKRSLDRVTKSLIKSEKKRSKELRKIAFYDGNWVAVDYSGADHIEYRYLLSRFITDYEIKEKLERTFYALNDEQSLIENAEEILDIKISEDGKGRIRR